MISSFSIWLFVSFLRSVLHFCFWKFDIDVDINESLEQVHVILFLYSILDMTTEMNLKECAHSLFLLLLLLWSS